MRKPDSLRAALVAAAPDLTIAPDDLLVFVEEGRIVGRWSAPAPQAFEYRYVLRVGLIDFAGDVNAIFAAVTAWAALKQPDLLVAAGDRDGITFAADLVDESKADVSIRLRLAEPVLVSIDADGRRTVTYVAEPGPDLYGLAAAAGPDLTDWPPLTEAGTTADGRIV